MRRIAAAFLTFGVFLCTAPACLCDEPVSPIDAQVLRVFATKNSPYYHKPWKSPDFAQVRGSGFFFRDEKLFPGREGLILTNAHAVTMAQSIRVSNGREKRRYDVKLVGICDTADFAILEMEPAELRVYEQRNGKVNSLPLGDSDALRVGDKVLGWGYPLGGEGIAKSEQGEISRIEVKRYAHSQESWLMVQASLQQNRGNSGGPVLKDGDVVGISFQGISSSDRLNYFIPINLVKHLIPVLRDQKRIPSWRYIGQQMFPRLKEYFGMAADDGGVLLDYIIPGGGPDLFGLKPDDIIVEIDENPIDNYGDIFFKPLQQKVYFGEVLKRKLVGDPLKIKVIRSGDVKELTGPATPGLPMLVPKVFTTANYFIYSGIGFVELTQNCLDNLDKSGDLLRAKYAGEFPKLPYQKIVIISEVFPEYGLVDTAPFLNRVEKIDDEEVLNLQDLWNKIEQRKARGVKKVLLRIAQNVRLPLDMERADELDKQIKSKYSILYMKSPEGFRE